MCGFLFDGIYHLFIAGLFSGTFIEKVLVDRPDVLDGVEIWRVGSPQHFLDTVFRFLPFRKFAVVDWCVVLHEDTVLHLRHKPLQLGIIRCIDEPLLFVVVAVDYDQPRFHYPCNRIPHLETCSSASESLMDILALILLLLGAPKTDLPKLFAYFKARLVSPNNSFPINPRPILFISSKFRPIFDMSWL